MSSKISLQRFGLTTAAIAVGLFAALPVAHAACNATAPDARYTATGGEVYDSQSNLTWQRCSVGQTWSQDMCTGKVEGMTWDQAARQKKGAWRVPTRDELLTLVETPCGISKANRTIFPNIDDLQPMYWSSTAEEKDLAWLVGVTNAGTFNGYRTSLNAVRLVRSGK